MSCGMVHGNISDVCVGLLKYNVPSILSSTKIMGLTFYINTVVHCWLYLVPRKNKTTGPDRLPVFTSISQKAPITKGFLFPASSSLESKAPIHKGGSASIITFFKKISVGL